MKPLILPFRQFLVLPVHLVDLVLLGNLALLVVHPHRGYRLHLCNLRDPLDLLYQLDL